MTHRLTGHRRSNIDTVGDLRPETCTAAACRRFPEKPDRFIRLIAHPLEADFDALVRIKMHFHQVKFRQPEAAVASGRRRLSSSQSLMPELEKVLN